MHFALSHAYAVWAAVGPLVGVTLGAWLAARWQRKKWLLDNKTLEYRSLFDALGEYRFALTEYYALYKLSMVVVSAQKKYDDDIAFAKSRNAVTNALDDRLFIREAVEKSGAKAEWASYAKKSLSNQPPDLDESLRTVDAMHQKLVKASQHDLEFRAARGRR